MGVRIDFEAKTDRELLLLTAQTTNTILDRLDVLNGTVRQHNVDIAKLKGKASTCTPAETMKQKISSSLGRGGLIFIIAALSGGGLYAFGNAIGWW